MATCPDVENVIGASHLTTNTSSGTFQLGEAVTFQCAEGYHYVTGNLTRVCDVNGTWSGLPIVCAEDKEDNTKTILISAAATVVACILFLILFRIDFHRYQKKKAKSREYRTRCQIKDGESRPTSFIISRSVSKMIHLNSSPYYLNSMYQQRHHTTEQGDSDTLKQTLNNDMQYVLGGPDIDHRGSKKSKSKRKSKNHKPNMVEVNNASVQTDPSLLESPITPMPRSQSLSPNKKKRKKHRIQPIENRLAVSLDASESTPPFDSSLPLLKGLRGFDHMMPVDGNPYPAPKAEKSSKDYRRPLPVRHQETEITDSYPSDYFMYEDEVITSKM